MPSKSRRDFVVEPVIVETVIGKSLAPDSSSNRLSCFRLNPDSRTNRKLDAIPSKRVMVKEGSTRSIWTADVRVEEKRRQTVRVK